MNCRGWNPHIALYIEGDLELNLAQQLEAHLSMCEECRTFVEELRQTQDDVRVLKADAVDATALNRVRRKVLDQVHAIERRRTWLDRAGIWLWGSFRWRYAVLGGMALLFASVAIWRLTIAVKPVALPPAAAIVSNERQTAAASPAPHDFKTSPRRRPSAAVVRNKPEPSAPAAIVPPVPVAPVPALADTAAVHKEGEKDQKDTVIQILTDDPNIVIYWLVDQTGGF